MHGCCWETFYIFAYCGLVGNPHLAAIFSNFCSPSNVNPGFGVHPKTLKGTTHRSKLDASAHFPVNRPFDHMWFSCFSPVLVMAPTGLHFISWSFGRVNQTLVKTRSFLNLTHRDLKGVERDHERLEVLLFFLGAPLLFQASTSVLPPATLSSWFGLVA